MIGRILWITEARYLSYVDGKKRTQYVALAHKGEVRIVAMRSSFMREREALNEGFVVPTPVDLVAVYRTMATLSQLSVVIDNIAEVYRRISGIPADLQLDIDPSANLAVLLRYSTSFRMTIRNEPVFIFFGQIPKLNEAMQLCHEENIALQWDSLAYQMSLDQDISEQWYRYVVGKRVVGRIGKKAQRKLLADPNLRLKTSLITNIAPTLIDDGVLELRLASVYSGIEDEGMEIAVVIRRICREIVEAFEKHVSDDARFALLRWQNNLWGTLLGRSVEATAEADSVIARVYDTAQLPYALRPKYQARVTDFLASLQTVEPIASKCVLLRPQFTVKPIDGEVVLETAIGLITFLGDEISDENDLHKRQKLTKLAIRLRRAIDAQPKKSLNPIKSNKYWQFLTDTCRKIEAEAVKIRHPELKQPTRNETTRIANTIDQPTALAELDDLLRDSDINVAAVKTLLWHGFMKHRRVGMKYYDARLIINNLRWKGLRDQGETLELVKWLAKLGVLEPHHLDRELIYSIAPHKATTDLGNQILKIVHQDMHRFV